MILGKLIWCYFGWMCQDLEGFLVELFGVCRLINGILVMELFKKDFIIGYFDKEGVFGMYLS